MSYSPFRALKLFPDYSTGHKLQWLLDPAFHEQRPYTFVLQLAEVPTFSTVIWSTTGTNTYYLTDNSGIKQTNNNGFIYRVILTTASGNTYVSPALAFGSDAESRRNYLLAAEITRKEKLRMRYTGKGTTTEVWLLKRKSVGPNVFALVDEVTGEPVADSGPDYGTGIDGGYYDPVRCMFSWEACDHLRALSPNGTGVVASDPVNFRMVGFPYLDTRDVIVDNDIRYSIEKVNTTPFPGSNIDILQEGRMLAISPADPIYQIKV